MPLNRKYMLGLTLLLAASLAVAAPANAASTLPSGLENPLTLSYPALANAPAPSWLEEGIRATYFVMASTAEFERKDDIEEMTGSPGQGLSQVDVVALEEGKAATFTMPYAPDLQGAMRQLPGFGSQVPVGCGDFWCSPATLNSIQERIGEDLTVTKGPFDLGGQEYRAIRFNFKTETLEMGLVYDLETGLMLYHTVDYVSSALTDYGSVSSQASHAIYQLRNIRQVDIPWKEGSIPSWLAPGQTLEYQGQTAIQVSGASPMYSPLAIKLSILGLHDRFTEERMDTYTQDPIPPPYAISVSGISQAMGSWLPTEALDTAQGVIDSDPDTGMVTAVVQSGPEGIVLEKTNQVNFRERFTYDHSGKLVQIYQEFNPDVITSVGFGSIKVITLTLT